MKKKKRKRCTSLFEGGVHHGGGGVVEGKEIWTFASHPLAGLGASEGAPL